MVAVTTYITEVAGVSHRGSALAYQGLMRTLGMMLCLSMNRHLHWPHICLVYAGLMVLLSVAFFWYPESPAYLLMQRKEEEARGVLQKLRAADAGVEVELQWIKRYDTQGKTNAGFLCLLRPPLVHHTMTVAALAAVAVFAGSAMIVWNGMDMMLAGGLLVSREVARITVAAGLAAGGVTLGCLVDRKGRRFPLLMSLVILVVAYCVVGGMDYAADDNLTIEPLTTAREATDTVHADPNR